MVKKTKSQLTAEEILNELAAVIQLYMTTVYTIKKQKLFAQLEYEKLISDLGDSLLMSTNLKDKIEEKKFETGNIKEVLDTLIISIRSLHPILIGLNNKANRTGKYGWFRYRRDERTHSRAESAYKYQVKLFSDIIEIETDHAGRDNLKALHVVEISRLINDLKQLTYDKIQKLFDDNNKNFMSSKETAFKTSLWIDATTVNIFRNWGAVEIADSLVNYRARNYGTMYQMTENELRDYYNDYPKRAIEAMKYTVPGSGVIFTTYLSDIGIPREDFNVFGMRMPLDFDNLLLEHATMIEEFIKTHNLL